LRLAAHDNSGRANTLKKLLEEAGCTGDRLEEQSVKHLKVPNVICTWPGATDQRILVSAHTDHVPRGDGTVDEWSGAAMLVNLLDSLRTTQRHHTFVFIGFSGEEEGSGGLALLREVAYRRRSSTAVLAKPRRQATAQAGRPDFRRQQTAHSCDQRGENRHG
jgi:acetylornithine deacetylase/succinyl-diaminopimelate desuccinylase-like protein